MKNPLTIFDAKLLDLTAANDLLKHNRKTQQYGLRFTYDQALEIIHRRNYELRGNRRIEWGQGILSKIIDAFYTSPYISQSNYKETICDLVELFYYYKNETCDCLSDDELISYMKFFYNGSCHGSLQLLASRELEQLAREIRHREL